MLSDKLANMRKLATNLWLINGNKPLSDYDQNMIKPLIEWHERVLQVSKDRLERMSSANWLERMVPNFAKRWK